jgi:serine/threonine-protein kinase
MGVVYRAEDTRLHRTVALKFLSPELTRDEVAKKRFLREAQAASAIDHPNICTVHEIDESDDGQLFISMAFYEGASLKQRMAGGPLTVRQTLEIAHGLTQGLECAHSNKIIHRDVKPANVMVTNDGFVKIVDFGLAKLAGQSKVTRSGSTLGTVAYMAPEQAKGSDVDRRADLWSVGVVMYEMLTGMLPFRGDIDHAMVYSIINESPIPLAERRDDVPDGLVAIVERCLQKNPDERYTSGAELMADLGALAHEMGWDSAVTTIRVSRSLLLRHRVRLAVLAVAVVAMAVAGWWYFQRPPSVYTTDLRLAVVPVKEHVGSDAEEAFYDGLMQLVGETTHDLARRHESAWVVPFGNTRRGAIAGPSETVGVFGVNRVMAGDMQRFGDGHRLTLSLQDAESGREIRRQTVDFDMGRPLGLQAAVIAACADLLRVSGAGEAGDTKSPDALLATLQAVGFLQLRDESATSAAVELVEHAVDIDSNYALARITAARAFAARKGDGDLDKARVHARRATEIADDDPRPWQVLGDISRADGDGTQAVGFYERAIALDASDIESYVDLAGTMMEESRMDEAESICAAAIDQAPDYYRTHANFGYLLQVQGRTEEAALEYGRALELAPRVNWIINNLGMIYYRNEEWDRASEMFERAFAIKPYCDLALNLGSLMAYQHRFEEAENYYEFGAQYCDSTNYLVWGNWASVAFWLPERREEALEMYGRAIRLAEAARTQRPDDREVLGHLIDYYGMTKQRELALELIEEAAPIAATNSKLMFYVGCAYENLGERENALRYIGDALRHGYPVKFVEAEPTLNDLREDLLFKQMIADGEDGGG